MFSMLELTRANIPKGLTSAGVPRAECVVMKLMSCFQSSARLDGTYESGPSPSAQLATHSRQSRAYSGRFYESCYIGKPSPQTNL